VPQCPSHLLLKEKDLTVEVVKTNNQQPTTNNQQPITNNQQPTTNNQKRSAPENKKLNAQL
jgi:hypothetical protein